VSVLLSLFFRSQNVTGIHLPEEAKKLWSFMNGVFMWACLSYWHFAVPMCHITQFLTPSWEFMITLDYEWNVIRGRRPYRWTIWVCNHSPFFCYATFQWATIWFAHLVDLLPYPCGRPGNCGSKYVYHQCYDPNELWGMCHVICLRPYSCLLTAHFFKVAIDLQFVRTLTHRKVRRQSS